jgi:hypothetical protein
MSLSPFLFSYVQCETYWVLFVVLSLVSKEVSLISIWIVADRFVVFIISSTVSSSSCLLRPKIAFTICPWKWPMSESMSAPT